MAHAEAGAEGSLGPSSDAQSAVYLLAVDSIDDLHSVPLDADQPPGPEDSSTDCVVPAVPSKEPPACLEYIPGPPCRPCGLCSLGTFISLILIAALANFGLLLYITYIYRHQDKVLQMLTQRLDAQIEILRQMASNQHMAVGHNPGEM